jgi:hypothetical protein
MRGQSGTTSLRAIVYMDEIFGFLPPIENPPSKLPMLTLLKQARAFGVGMVLATQNPVDLDYKALSNAGTWFIGRLQTERDKGRLLDGLDSASASSGINFNRSQIESILSKLGNRVFLMNNTHEDRPEIFQTRWALSYLRGPLTRDQIKSLMDPLKESGSVGMTQSKVPMTKPTSVTSTMVNSNQPATLPPDIPNYFLPVRGSPPSGKKLSYLPGILGAAKVNFSDTKTNIDLSESKVYFTPVTDNPIPVTWDASQEIEMPATDLERGPQQDALFGDLPSAASQSKNYAIWNREFINWLYGTQKVELFASPSLKEVSRPGETEAEFRIRLGQSARERRDEMVDQLRIKYTNKKAILQERLRRALQVKEKQAEQAKQAKLQTAVSIGSTLLSAFTGRKVSRSTISRASSAFRGASRAADESKDVSRAGETVEAIEQQIADLQADFNAEIAALQEKTDITTEIFQTIVVKPNKSDILVQLVVLVWMPYWQDSLGSISPAW